MRFSRSRHGGLWSNEQAMKTDSRPADSVQSGATSGAASGAVAGARADSAAVPASPGPRVGAAGRLAAQLPLPVLLGAVIGEAASMAMGGSMRGTGALAGAAVAAAVAPLAAWMAWRMVPHAPASKASATEVASTRDQLTGAFTQRHFVAAADREWSRLRRHDEDAALLMVDADQLRELNEKHGQACGDAVLVEITRLVSATLRQYDLMARFGSGVLVVYLPHTDPIGALDVAERVRERVAAFRLNWNGQPVGATVSVGVAAIGPDHAALDAVIADAGTALREAKMAGRNCVRAAPVQPWRAPAAGSSVGGHRAAGKA
jgi:diguanylate cyclase